MPQQQPVDLLFGSIPEAPIVQSTASQIGGGAADLFGFGGATAAAYSAATGYVPPKTVSYLFTNFNKISVKFRLGWIRLAEKAFKLTVHLLAAMALFSWK
jgi:hypothetical protein